MQLTNEKVLIDVCLTLDDEEKKYKVNNHGLIKKERKEKLGSHSGKFKIVKIRMLLTRMVIIIFYCINNRKDIKFALKCCYL